jgi:hypothetical protein
MHRSRFMLDPFTVAVYDLQKYNNAEAASKQNGDVKLASSWRMVRKQASDSPGIFCGICPKALHPHNRG